MILRSVTVESFGALADRTLELAPGLNVILGPNEAGKSTLFQAILHTLLTPSRLGRREFKALQPFLPAGGGDTIACSLRLSHGEGAYRLRRSWGAAQEALLVLPDGARLTDDGGIAAVLGELLPAAAGTLRSVFFTYQSGLPDTLKELDPQALRSLQDLLRTAVLESDGVSVAGFQALLEERYRQYFDHWDEAAGCPEGNRGIERPWASRKGRILRAYYGWRSELQRHRETLRLEEEYGRLARELEELACARSETEDFLRRYEQAAADAEERARLENELQATELAAGRTQEDYDRWPVLLARRTALAGEIPELEARRAALEGESRQAQAYEEGRRQRERLERAAERQTRLDEARKAAATGAPLAREQLEEIRAAAAAIQRIRAELLPRPLQVTVESRGELPLAVEELESPPLPPGPSSAEAPSGVEHRLAPGQSLEVRSSGALRLTHPEWTLTVRADSEAEAARREELRRQESRLARLLKECGAADPAGAEEAARRHEQLRLAVEHARRELQEELQGQTLAQLEEQAAPAAPAPSRPLGAILQELASAGADLQRRREEEERTGQELAGLEKTYGNREALLDRVVELRSRRNAAAGRLASLAGIPEGFPEAGAFLEHYRRQRGRLEELRGQHAGKAVECARAEERMPQESSEEIGARVLEQERGFQRELRRGQAVSRIRRTAAAILAAVDPSGFRGFAELLSGYAREMTGGRYADVPVAETVPTGLRRGDGTVLSPELLSAGTRDALFLSLRLSMAEMFLCGREGFLMMDDPLVDLDPERQALAASALRRFADLEQGRQLLLFTCHPAHAQRFPGARLLELAPPQV